MNSGATHSGEPDAMAPPNKLLADVQEWISQSVSAHGGSRVIPPEWEAELTERFAALENAANRVVHERDGMANELLRAYEHLGILFEVTRMLPNAHSETEIVGLFLESLQQSYPHSTVWMVSDCPEGTANDSKSQPSTHRHGGANPYVASARDDTVDAAVNRCQAERRVVVEEEQVGARLVRQVLAGPVFAGNSFVCAIVVSQGQAGSLASPLDVADMQLVDSLVMFCGDLVRNLRLVDALRSMSIDVVRALVSTVDQKDKYTAGHSTRVGYYARLLGQELGFDDQQLQMLEWAALLHDVGKIGIRDDVLAKPGKLTEAEFDHIRSHPVRSAEVVRQIPQLTDALAGVRHHHEHYDGSGYPDGLVGEAIPLQARVIQIGDVFDALTTTRSYRKAFTWQKALDILQSEAGRTGDPRLVKVFDRLIRQRITKNTKMSRSGTVAARDADNATGQASRAPASGRGGPAARINHEKERSREHSIGH